MIIFRRRDLLGLVGFGATTALLPDRVAASAKRHPRWRPDGTGLPRLGLLVGDFDWNPEIEMAVLNQRHANVFASRMAISSFQGLSDLAHADAAADLLRRLDLRAILYTGTSTSYVFGLEKEKQFKDRLESRTNKPVVIPAMALADAAKALGVRRIALVHPPWFTEETNELGRAYFRARGFDVVSARPITPRRTLSEVPAQEVYRWIVANTPPQAEAVVQGGGGLRMIGAIEALERTLGRPVITANQATFWQGLKLAGVRARISGYGRLLTL
jgi:maleate isomerase